MPHGFLASRRLRQRRLSQGVRLGVITRWSQRLLLFRSTPRPGRVNRHGARNQRCSPWMAARRGRLCKHRAPLVWTIPPSDGLNTVGVVPLGATVIVVRCWRHRTSSLTDAVHTAAFAGVMLSLAAIARHVNETNHRAVMDSLFRGLRRNGVRLTLHHRPIKGEREKERTLFLLLPFSVWSVRSVIPNYSAGTPQCRPHLEPTVPVARHSSSMIPADGDV